MSPPPGLATLNAGPSSRPPEGAAMLVASSRKHIACGPAWGGPALGPQLSFVGTAP